MEKIKLTKKSAGFTLIELLLVVVLISILSGVVLSVVNVGGLRARSRDAQRAGDLKRIQTALELYFSDNRGYPQNSSSWMSIVSSGSDILNTALKGNYIQVIPQDPRNGEAMSAAACNISNFGYYYRTDACSGAGCLASRYVISTFMESVSAAEASTCNKLQNCTSGNISSCNCAVPCYGVENPL
jgi:prepilin-type N-terminal cleavage/methylation domain-containing protein